MNRDELTAEVVAEVRGILAELKGMAEPPTLNAAWSTSQGNPLADFQASRASMEQHLAGWRDGSAVVLPEGVSVTMPWLGKPLSRLLALLEMSPGERAFVQAAADASVAGDYMAVDGCLGVFADWLTDQGRDADGRMIQGLRVRDGDMLVFRPSADADEVEREELVTAARAAVEVLASLGRRVGWLVFGRQGQTVASLDEEAMEENGWVPKSEHDQIACALSHTLVDEPEIEEAGASTAQQVVKMIRRLKAENAELRKATEASTGPAPQKRPRAHLPRP